MIIPRERCSLDRLAGRDKRGLFRCIKKGQKEGQKEGRARGGRQGEDEVHGGNHVCKRSRMLRTRRLPAINSDGRGRRVNKEICTWRKVAGNFTVRRYMLQLDPTARTSKGNEAENDVDVSLG